MVSPDKATVSGNRLADLLHIATTIHLGAESFLTLDKKRHTLTVTEKIAFRAK